MDAIICKANVNLPMETSHKERYFKFVQCKLKKNSYGRPRNHATGRKMVEILPVRPKCRNLAPLSQTREGPTAMGRV